MLASYRNILAAEGAVKFTAAGALGRLPASMTGLGIILLVSARTGSYTPAGIIAAAYILVSAVFGPIQGRLADRYGQAPVLYAAGALFTAGVIGFLLTVDSSLFVAGAFAALMGTGAPQTGNMVRSRWTNLLPDRSGLQTAFALEAVLDEAVFIIGPVLITVLTLSALDWSGLAIAGVAAIVGAWGLAIQRATQPPHREHAHAADQPLRWSLLAPLVGAAVGLGVLFGSAEVLVVAFTEEHGAPKAAGAVLAVWSAGSLLAGVFIGTRPAPNDPVVRLRITTLGLVLLFVPLIFADSVLMLTIGFFLAGLMVAPTLITAVNLVELNTPAARLTEALTWTTTGLSAGVAAGGAFAGYLVDRWSASTGFILPTVAALGAAGVALFFRSQPTPLGETKEVCGESPDPAKATD